MLYPKQPSAYPQVYLEATDRPLPKDPNSRMRYAYFTTIARGGTCVISSCKDLHLMRTVCYKTLRHELADNDLEQLRFIREARVTAMLQHTNTVPTYELGRDVEGHVYFTMKLVHGSTFREILDACSKRNSHEVLGFTFEKLINVVSQVCHALHYAHSHGVVHRDVKPENILVGSFGEVLLLDWGMAKVWAEKASHDPAPLLSMSEKFKLHGKDVLTTARGPLKGTPAYLSPEQLEHANDVDHRSDIFCIGSILYELLSLKRMIPGDTVSEVLDFLRANDIPPPTGLIENQASSKYLAEICMKSVARKQDDRYQSMEGIIDGLEQWLIAR